MQATLPGFISRGLSIEEAEKLLEKSVTLAVESRDKFWETVKETPELGYNRAFVAASIGSYGAYLADGSEYRYAFKRPILINLISTIYIHIYLYIYV